MAYTLEYNRTLNIVEIVLTGQLTDEECREANSKVIALSKEHGDADALIDASEVELRLSILDLFVLPSRQYVEEDVSHSMRAAVVSSRRPKDKEALEFYETACNNRGWQVRLFPNRVDAIGWLRGNDSSNKPDAGDGT